jgi:hypothetical protein
MKKPRTTPARPVVVPPRDLASCTAGAVDIPDKSAENDTLGRR